MKLSDIALGGSSEEEPAEAEDVGESAFADAATEAFELWGKGKKSEAVASLKAAVESCVADYMAEDEPEVVDEE